MVINGISELVCPEFVTCREKEPDGNDHRVTSASGVSLSGGVNRGPNKHRRPNQPKQFPKHFYNLVASSR
jgi:hypothetical protein